MGSRTPPPPPLQTGPVRAVTSPVTGTPKSVDTMASPKFSGEYCTSPTSPTSLASTSAPLLWERKGSEGSNANEDTSLKRPVSPRKVNANSYCGRHSDQFLFNGKGLGDLWRAVTRK